MDKLKITLPTDWTELEDQQLYYVYNLIADNLSAPQIKTYCLFRFGKLSMVCRYGDGFLVKHERQEYLVTAETIAGAIRSLDFLDDVPARPVRISKIKGHRACDPMLRDIDFQTYLYIDNLYQGFLSTQQHEMLNDMGQMLYDSHKILLNQAQKMSVFYWWTAAKMALAAQFPYLFRGAGGQNNLIGDTRSLSKKMNDAMNNQIRALTKGDITKEEQVLKMDLWRALNELDNIAREAEELEAKSKHNG